MRDIDQVRALLASVQEEDQDLLARRQGYEAVGATMPVADGVTIDEVGLRGVSGLKFTPDDGDTERALLYFHGGGYVLGSPSTHRGLVSHLAKAMKATAYSMDYALAPERPYPGAVSDGLASFRGLIETGIDAGNVVIAGDSAGGGLTVATAMKIRDDGLPAPAGLGLLSPWVNLTNTGWSYGAKSESDPMVDRIRLTEMAAAYLDDQPATTPYASPLYGDLQGLPDMYIQTGSEEVLLSDSTALAERASAAGVYVNLELWPEMIHVFQYFHGMLSDARQAIARMGAWGAHITKT